MSVHYKFKTAVTFDTICFDGLHISVGELKKSIKQQKKIGKSSDYDLQITDAQTKEVYENEDDLIPKNTSVIVARIPLAQPLKKTSERGDLSLFGQDVDSPPHSYDTLSKTADLANADASEEDKIKAMIGQSGQEYDFGKMKNKMVGTPPPCYSCFRCNQTGHWIKDCPTNNVDIKRSTGIPKSFMIPVEGPNAKGALLTSSGEYAVPLIDHLAYQEVKKERPFYKEQEQIVKPKPAIPQEIQCGICKDPMKDAVLTPCCAENFCDECIRQSLLDSENNECIACHAIDISPNCLVPCRYLRLKILKYNSQEESFTANSPAEDISKMSPARKLDASPLSSPLKEAKTDTDEADKENKSPFRNSEDFISDNLKEPGTPLADEPCDEVSNRSGADDKVVCKANDEETNSISTILTRTNLVSYGKGISSAQETSSNYSSKYYERPSSTRFDSHYNKRRSPPRRYARRSPDRRYLDDHRARDDRSYRGRERPYESRNYKASNADYKYENTYHHRPNHQPPLPPTQCYPPPQLYESEAIQPPAYPPALMQLPVSFPTQPPPPGEAPTSSYPQPPPPGVVPSLPLGIPPPSHSVYLPPHSTAPPAYTTRASSSRTNIDEFLVKPSRTHSYSRSIPGSRLRYRRSKSWSRSRSKSPSYSPSPPRGHSRSRSRSFHRYSRSRSRSHSRTRTLRYTSRKAVTKSPPYKDHSTHYEYSEDEEFYDPEYVSYKGRRARYDAPATKHESSYSKYPESSYNKIKSHTTINKGSSSTYKKDTTRREMPSVIQLVREVKTEPPKIKEPVEENVIRKVRIVHKENKAEKELKKIKVELKETVKEAPREDELNNKVEEPISSLPYKEKHKHKHNKEEMKKKKKRKKKLSESTPNNEKEVSDHKVEKPKKRKSKTKTECQTHKKAKLEDTDQTPESNEPTQKEDNSCSPQDINESEHDQDKSSREVQVSHDGLDTADTEADSRDKLNLKNENSNNGLEIEPDSVMLEPNEDLELETDENERSPTPAHDELHIELPELSRWERDDYEEDEDNISKNSPKFDDAKTKEGGLSSEIIKRAEKAILQKPLKAARVVSSPPFKSNEVSIKAKIKDEVKEKYHSPELQVTISNNKDSRSVHPKPNVSINRQFEKRREEAEYKRKLDKKQSQTITRHVKVEPLREVEKPRKRSRSTERMLSHEKHSKERHSHERNFSRERPSSHERHFSRERPSHERNLSKEKISREQKSKHHTSHYISLDTSRKSDSLKESRSSESRKHHHHHSRSHDHRKHARSKSPIAESRPKRLNRESPLAEQEQSQSSKDESSNDKTSSKDANSRDKIERRLSTYNESKFEPNYDATSESENEVFRQEEEEENLAHGKQISKKQETINERLSSVDSAPSSDASSRSSSPASRKAVSPDDLRHRLNKKYKSKKHKKHKSNKHKKKKSSHKLSKRRDS